MNMDPTGECYGPLAYVCAAAAGAAINVAIGIALDYTIGDGCYTWDEFKSDALWGAAGGGVFKGLGAAYRAVKAANKARNAAKVAASAPIANYTVYQGINKTTGIVEYIGITMRAVATRGAEHAATSAAKAALTYVPVPGASGLTKQAARILEQKLINQYGGVKGGQLLNEINSIASKYWSQLGI